MWAAGTDLFMVPYLSALPSSEDLGPTILREFPASASSSRPTGASLAR